MCLLVLQKDRTRNMNYEEFKKAWTINWDGFWLYIALWDKTRIEKTKSLAEAWAIYSSAVKKKFDLLVYHFRMGTHWPNSEKLIHPFDMWDGVNLFHNGILPIEPVDEEESDTSTLALQYKIHWVPSSFILWEYNLYTLKDLCGGYNKLILTKGSEFKIVNEKAGHWDNGTWFSNYNYYVHCSTYNKWKPSCAKWEQIYEIE